MKAYDSGKTFLKQFENARISTLISTHEETDLQFQIVMLLLSINYMVVSLPRYNSINLQVKAGKYQKNPCVRTFDV